ncbi:hypothetical protein E1301_Tti007267 [Triplophysa tibetana]|uniref:Uncharacterized protein n=1 Tax=Triplophysa tibetana TaxID=1572043 RepID=A0A5A9NZD6_9TELE|nr:hypothetical protein E1301_Tti007267 [Triplophysa tibetana]
MEVYKRKQKNQSKTNKEGCKDIVSTLQGHIMEMNELILVMKTTTYKEDDVGIATVELKIFRFNCSITRTSLGRLFTSLMVTIMKRQGSNFSNSITIIREQIHRLVERGRSATQEQTYTVQTSFLLSQETSSGNLFSARLPQLLSNKRVWVEEEKGVEETEKILSSDLKGNLNLFCDCQGLKLDTDDANAHSITPSRLSYETPSLLTLLEERSCSALMSDGRPSPLCYRLNLAIEKRQGSLGPSGTLDQPSGGQSSSFGLMDAWQVRIELSGLSFSEHQVKNVVSKCDLCYQHGRYHASKTSSSLVLLNEFVLVLRWIQIVRSRIRMFERADEVYHQDPGAAVAMATEKFSFIRTAAPPLCQMSVPVMKAASKADK